MALTPEIKKAIQLAFQDALTRNPNVKQSSIAARFGLSGHNSVKDILLSNVDKTKDNDTVFDLNLTHTKVPGVKRSNARYETKWREAAGESLDDIAKSAGLTTDVFQQALAKQPTIRGDSYVHKLVALAKTKDSDGQQIGNDALAQRTGAKNAKSIAVTKSKLRKSGMDIPKLKRGPKLMALLALLGGAASINPETQSFLSASGVDDDQQ